MSPRQVASRVPEWVVGLLAAFALIAMLFFLAWVFVFAVDADAHGLPVTHGTLELKRVALGVLAGLWVTVLLAYWKRTRPLAALAGTLLMLLAAAGCAARGPWVCAEAPALELRACPCAGTPCMFLVEGDCLMPASGFDGHLLLRVSWDPAELGPCPAMTVRWPNGEKPAERGGEGAGCWVGPGRDYSYRFKQRFMPDDEGDVLVEARSGSGRPATAKLTIRRPAAGEQGS